MKSVAQRLVCTGLAADPNPHSSAPQGAMDIAENAVFRRPGTAEPRPGFCEFLSNRVGFLGFDTPEGAIAHEDDVIVQDANSELRAYAADTDYQGDDSIVDGAIGCLPSAVRGHSQGDALYFCGQDNMRKLYTGTTRTVAAGAPVPVLVLETLAHDEVNTCPINPESYVAFRATISIVYPERTVMSAPSGRVVTYNTDATWTADVELYAYLPDEVRVIAPTATMYLHVWRSKNSSVSSPPDELFEAYPKWRITQAHVDAGFIYLPGMGTGDPNEGKGFLDADLGAALYTNPSRETMARANARPPGPRDIQQYAASTFLAQPLYAQRAFLRWSDVDLGDRTGEEEGIGWRLVTVDTTADSALLENVSSFVGIRVGQLVAIPGNELQAPGTLYVVGIDEGNATITLSAVLEDTSVGANAYFFDALHVTVDGDTRRFPVSTADVFLRCVAAGGIGQGIEGGLLAPDAMDAEAPPCFRGITVRAFGIGDTARFKNAGSPSQFGGDRVVVLERTDANGAAFTYACTHGAAMNDDIPEPTEAAEDWAQSDRPSTAHCVAWSKNAESEHFLEGGYLGIGLPSVPVLRIFAMRDGLYILKARGDGIYRLTGFGERSGWRVQQLSATASLIHADLACSTGEAIYAWTTEGAVELTAGGINQISVGLHDMVHRYVMRIATYDTADLLWWCIPNVKDGEVLWGLQSDTQLEGNHSPENIYVFNYRTRCWSVWFPDEYRFCAAAVTAQSITSPAQQAGIGQNLIVLLPEGVGTEEDLNWARIERTANYGKFTNSDEQHAATVNSVNGLDVVIDATVNWTPQVGDALVEIDGDNTVYSIVTVDDATHFTVDLAGLATGSIMAYEAYPFRLRWLPDFGGGPIAAKRFEAVTAHFETAFMTTRVRVDARTPPIAGQEFTHTLQGTVEDRSEVDAAGVPTQYPADVRAPMNADSGWGHRLLPGVYIRQAGSQARVSGVTVEYRDAAATRGRRAG